VLLLDTNVLSELMKDGCDANVKNWYEVNADAVAFATPALGEIAFGIAKLPDGKKRDILSRRFTEWRLQHLDRTYPFASATVLIYGDLVAEALSHKHNMDVIDAQVAAIACEHGGVVATRNIKDFQQVSVDTINPWIAI
jgi:toxin FitB